MIKLFCDNKEIPVNMIEFSDGAIAFKVDRFPESPNYISINVCPTTPVYRIREELELLIDATEQQQGWWNASRTVLKLPYLPYARADRIFEKGNGKPLYNFLSWLDLQGFDEVFVCDIHNPLVMEDFPLIKYTEKSQLDCYKASLPQDFNTKYDFVLAPDKGSVEKAKTIALHLGIPVYNCGKERDISTGKIIRSTLPENVDFTGKIVLIPDDLCDGNYTFYSLSKLLKEAGAKQVDLYVTHMIGSKGLSNVVGLVDKIYYYHIVGNYLTKDCILKFNEGCYIELGTN
ncbi:ribose-phosphate pyrophosphokinase [Vibrio phage 5P1b]